MFGFVNRDEHERIIEENERLNEVINDKLRYIDILMEDINKQRKENKNLEEQLKREKSNHISTQKALNTAIDTNKDLNNWINKIVNEVGIQELHEKTGVTIPVYIRSDKSVIGRISPDGMIQNYQTRQEIIIPELKFVKVGGME